MTIIIIIVISEALYIIPNNIFYIVNALKIRIRVIGILIMKKVRTRLFLSVAHQRKSICNVDVTPDVDVPD